MLQKSLKFFHLNFLKSPRHDAGFCLDILNKLVHFFSEVMTLFTIIEEASLLKVCLGKVLRLSISFFSLIAK